MNQQKKTIDWSKEQDLTMKQTENEKETVQRCIKMILNSEVSLALENLKDAITDNLTFDSTKTFMGAGNVEDWKFYYPKGPLEWFEKSYLFQQNAGNVFDLLNICFMVLLYQREMKVADILSEYDTLQEKHDQRFEFVVGKAHIYYQNQQFIKAKSLYEEVKESKEEFFQVELYLSWIFLMFNLCLEVKKHAERYLEKDPQNLQADMLKKLVSPTFSQRRQALLALLEKHPKFCRIYYQLANAAQNNELKLQFYQKAFEHEPKNAELASLIGKAHLDLSNTEKAQEYVNIVFQLEKDSAHGYNLLGLIESSKQNNGKARNFLQKAVDISPYSINFNESLSIFYREMSFHDQELKALQKLTEIDPFNDIYESEMGQIYQKRGNAQKAEECYFKAIMKNPIEESLWNYGCILLKHKQFGAAFSFFWKAYSFLEKNIGPRTISQKSYYHKFAVCSNQLKFYSQAREWAQMYLKVEDPMEQHRIQCMEIMRDTFLKQNNFLEYFRWEITLESLKSIQELPESLKGAIYQVGVEDMKTILSQLLKDFSADNSNSQALVLLNKMRVIVKEKEENQEE